MTDIADDLTKLLNSLKVETRESSKEEFHLISTVMKIIFQRDKRQGVKRISKT